MQVNMEDGARGKSARRTRRTDGRATASACVLLRRTEDESFVQTSEAVTLQIEADVPVAGGLQFAHDRGIDLGLERADHFLTRKLQPRRRGASAGVYMVP